MAERVIEDYEEMAEYLRKNKDKSVTFHFTVRTSKGPVERTWTVPRNGYSKLWGIRGNPDASNIRLVVEG